MEEEVQIRHFKLINGDQIIAAVNSKNKDNWFLGTPVQVSNALLGGFSFSPWFPFSKEDNYKVKFHNYIDTRKMATYLVTLTAILQIAFLFNPYLINFS